jgi:hypothetical protein
MISVHQPIEIARPPPELDQEARVEGGGHRKQDPHRNAVAVTSLDQRNERLRHGGGSGEVTLPPPTTPPEGAKPEPESNKIHAPTMAPWAYPPISRPGRL